MTYIVTCWASQEIEVEDANNEEDAERIALEECRFPYVDYCEVEEKI